MPIHYSWLIFIGLLHIAYANRGVVRDLTTIKFLTDCIIEHNAIRINHCAPLLKVDKTLVKIAKKRAMELAKSDGANFGHLTKARNFGENVHWYTGKKAANINCRSVVRNWYSERKNFDWAHDEQQSGIVGHFTQMIWSGSTKIGCASVLSLGPRGGAFTVCTYFPLGNIRRRITDNIMSKEMCNYHLQSMPSDVVKDLTNATWLQDCLREHNLIRALHGSKPLVLDKKITEYARRRALDMANHDYSNFGHSYGTPYGENIHWGKRRSGPLIKCAEPIELWYREKANYDWRDRRHHHGTYGHFTQMVWRDTKRLGCAQVASLQVRGGTYTVCAYDPWGILPTVEDQMENVQPMNVLLSLSKEEGERQVEETHGPYYGKDKRKAMEARKPIKEKVTEGYDVMEEEKNKHSKSSEEYYYDDDDYYDNYYYGEEYENVLHNGTTSNQREKVATSLNSLREEGVNPVDISKWYPNRKNPVDKDGEDKSLPDSLFLIKSKKKLKKNIDISDWYHGPNSENLAKLKPTEEIKSSEALPVSFNGPPQYPIIHTRKGRDMDHPTFQLPAQGSKSVKKQLNLKDEVEKDNGIPGSDNRRFSRSSIDDIFSNFERIKDPSLKSFEKTKL